MHERPPPFGKRNRPTSPASAPSSAPRAIEMAERHQAFFSALRSEHGDEEEGFKEVPRSMRAGVLAGIVVACGLAGLDATEKLASMEGLTHTAADQPMVRFAGPALILLAVIGGGQTATSLLLAHSGLARIGQTHHGAYAAAGAIAAIGFAAVMQAIIGQSPAHGFVVEAMAGAAGGFFYRVFAGARRKSV